MLNERTFSHISVEMSTPMFAIVFAVCLAVHYKFGVFFPISNNCKNFSVVFLCREVTLITPSTCLGKASFIDVAYFVLFARQFALKPITCISIIVVSSIKLNFSQNIWMLFHGLHNGCVINWFLKNFIVLKNIHKFGINELKGFIDDMIMHLPGNVG